MIANALDLVKDELQNYINSALKENTISVALENVANLETDSNNLEDKVLISLVNIEEESTFKNIPTYRKNSLSGGVDYKNPPVFLNLYVLFSCTLSSTATGERYYNSLTRLGLIIQFFQKKKYFSIHNSPNAALANSANQQGVNELKIIMDIYTLTFEQINYLWGSLGGKQVPFVMYKMRLVKVQDEQLQKTGSLITEIQSEDKIL